jgi:cytochrome c biogenesis protein ResB
MRRTLAHLGSLRTTLALFALLAAVVFARPGWPLLAPALALLASNLAAALVVHPAFRRQLPLLVAHLALLALVLGAGLGRLLALDGRFELLQGEAFDGTLLDRAAGPLHVDRLQRLGFRPLGFEVDYAPGLKRGATRNRVAWTGADGRRREAVIGDHHPLVLDGHRFYTSPNKGFAPVLRWEPAQGEPLRGAVHLPSYPAQALRQSRAWPLLDGREAWVQLQLEAEPMDPRAAATLRLPVAHRLVLRVDAERAELAPGQALVLPGGRLVYEELRTWMGYRVAHDPTLPWLLAAAVLAALALGLHYALKFRAAAPAPARGVLEATHG